MTNTIIFTKHFKGLDLKALTDAIKEAGAKGADLCVRPGYPVEPANASEALPEAVRIFKEEGLKVPQITLPTEFIKPEAPGVEEVFSACAKAQVGLLKLGYWSMGPEGYWESVETTRGDLEGFSRLAAKHAVKAMVHIHCDTLSMNSFGAMNLVNGFDPKYIGVFADSGHQALAGEPAAMALSALSEYLASVALKDLVRQKVDGKWRENMVPMGEGLVDWPAFIGSLLAMKYRGPISIHCEYDYALDELRAQAKRDVGFFHDQVGAIG